ncbi:MAG: MFS transporter [Chlamydiota bacterium]
MKTFCSSFGVCLAIFIAAMDWSIVNNALPSIQRDLAATLTELQWMVNALGLVLTVTMVSMGRFADACGRRRLFMIGLLVCVVSSLGAALSPSAKWLIGFRALQGLFVAITLTTSQSLMTHIFPEEKHGKAMGIYVTLMGLGLCMGPVLGGVILAIASWHWIFYLNLPIALLSAILVKLSVQESKNEQQSAKIDGLGLFILTIGLGALITAVIQGPDWGWSNPVVLGLFGVAAVFLVCFYFIEHRVSSPLIKFEFFKKKVFFAACLGNSSLVFLWWGVFFSFPLYLQNILQVSPFASGMFMLAMTAPFAVASHYAGPLGDKVDKKYLIMFGLIVAVAGLLAMTFLKETMDLVLMLAALILVGLGGGLIIAPSTSLGISAIPRNFSGVASGVLCTVQEMGGSLGLALVGTLLRAMEKNQLAIELQQEGLQLSEAMKHTIRSLLSSFDQLKVYLNQQSLIIHEKVLDAFKAAFVVGFHSGLWLCVGVAALCFTVIFLLTLPSRS